MTNCNPQQKPYHCVTHLHKHSKTGNRACIQTSYLTYTDTQNSPGLCLVMWNPLKTSLTFFPAPSLPLFYPGLDVVTVVWGFSELYSALRSSRDSWIMEIILMPRSLCQLNEMLAKMHEPQGPSHQILTTSCEIQSKHCTAHLDNSSPSLGHKVSLPLCSQSFLIVCRRMFSPLWVFLLLVSLSLALLLYINKMKWPYSDHLSL